MHKGVRTITEPPPPSSQAASGRPFRAGKWHSLPRGGPAVLPWTSSGRDRAPLRNLFDANCDWNKSLSTAEAISNREDQPPTTPAGPSEEEGQQEDSSCSGQRGSKRNNVFHALEHFQPPTRRYARRQRRQLHAKQVTPAPHTQAGVTFSGLAPGQPHAHSQGQQEHLPQDNYKLSGGYRPKGICLSWRVQERAARAFAVSIPVGLG
jgi:hypothetical protein